MSVPLLTVILKEINSPKAVLDWLKTPIGKKCTELMKVLVTAENNYMAFVKKHTNKNWNALTQSEKSEHDSLKKASENANRNEIAFRKKYILPASKELGVGWNHLIDAARENSGVKYLKQ
jgi:hypothetical protein